MQIRRRKWSRKVDHTMSASQTNSDLNVSDSFFRVTSYSFSFLILSPVQLNLPKFRSLQRKRSSLVPMRVNRDLPKRLWRTVELPLWETDPSCGSWICISWFHGPQRPLSQTQTHEHTSPQMAQIIWDMSYRVGEYNAAPLGDVMAIWRWRSGRILEGISGSSTFLFLGN